MARIYHGLSILQNFKTDNSINTCRSNTSLCNVSLNANNNNNLQGLTKHRSIPELLGNTEDQDSIEIITEYIPDTIA